MKKLFPFLLFAYLLFPAVSWSVINVDHQSLTLPECSSKVSLKANTFSFENSKLLLHLVDLGDCGTYVFNALNRKMIHGDPEGNFKRHDAPYFFDLSDKEILIASPSKTTIINKQDGSKLFSISGRLYEIKDYNGDGVNDFTIASFPDDYARNDIVDIELFLIKSTGSYELAGITEIINGDGVLNSDYVREMAQVRTKRADKRSSDYNKFVKSYKTLNYNPTTFELKPSKPYQPSTLLGRLNFPSGTKGIIFDRKNNISGKAHQLSQTKNDREKSKIAKKLGITSQFYTTLSASYDSCTLPPVNTNGKTLFCTPNTEVPFVNSIEGHSIIKFSSKNLVVGSAPDQSRWFYYNDHLIEQTASPPLVIDFRKVRGIGSGSMTKYYFGHRLYVMKHGKLNVFNTQDIITAFRNPALQQTKEIVDPFANQEVIEQSVSMTSPGLAGALPPIKNQTKLISSKSQKNTSKPNVKKDVTKSKESERDDWTKTKAVPQNKNIQVKQQSMGTTASPASSAPAKKEILSATDLRKKGTALAKAGKYNEALTFYNRALELKPKDLTTLNNMGLVLKKLGRLTKALKTYERAAKLYPDTPVLRKNIGLLYELLSIQEYQAYLELAPKAKDAVKVQKRIERLQSPVQ